MNITPEIEYNLWATTGVSSISDISGFPFSNYEDFKTSVANLHC
jgi:hypothetical protein